jgi:hypothetical protein
MLVYESILHLNIEPESFYRNAFQTMEPDQLIAKTNAINFIISDTGLFPDALCNHYNQELLFSDRLCAILKKEVGAHLLFSPAHLFDTKLKPVTGYQAVKIKRRVACLDLKESGVKYKKDSFMIREIARHVIDPGKIPVDAKIFRLAEEESYILIKESLFNALKDKEITGVFFDLVAFNKKYKPISKRGMGAWFRKNFDERGDAWLERLVSAHDISLIAQSFPTNLDVEMPFSDSIIALAAAEVVAAMKGNRARIHPAALPYVERCKHQLTYALVETAIDVVENVEKWSAIQAAADTPKRNHPWHARLHDLLKRLKAPANTALEWVPPENMEGLVSTLPPIVSHSLFVGNLSANATNQNLLTLFSQAGKVLQAKVGTAPDGRTRHGYVQMESDEQVITAINRFDDFVYGGRELTVTAVRKEGNLPW